MADNDIIQTPVFMDMADWRLIIYIESGRLQAYLKSIVNKEMPIRLACDSSWEVKEPADQLRGLETTVYDRPSLLDDYEADIIIDTSSTIFVPSAAVEEPGDAEILYSTFYDAPDVDIFIDRLGTECCLYSPAPRMKPFIERTFPGARIASTLTILIDKMRTMSTGKRIYAHLNEKIAIVIAFDGEQLLCAASHPASDAAEAAYHIVHARAVYGLTDSSTRVWLSGTEAMLKDVENILITAGIENAITPMPSFAGAILPLAAAFCANRPIKRKP